MTAIVGLVTPLPEACASGLAEVVDIRAQFVLPASGRFHEVDQGDDLPVVLYAGEFGADPCAGVGAEIIASGLARLTLSGSFASDGAGHLVQRAHGPVTFDDGGAGQFSGRLDLYFGTGGEFLRATGDVVLARRRAT